MSKWQPIETAPRDGTRIIVGAFRGRGRMGWVSNAYWFDRGNDERGRYCGWTDGFDTLAEPTHWQPLVPPTGE